MSRSLSVKSVQPKVERIYIAVAEGADSEGIFSVYGPNGETIPVAAVDDKGLHVLGEYVRKQVNNTGQTVSIIGFTKRTHHETFRPLSTGDKK